MSISVFAQTLCEITRRAFYAFSDTKSVLIIDGSATVFNLMFITIAAKSGWGILGLTVGIAIADLIRLVLFSLRLEKKINLITKEAVFSWSKMGVATILSGFSSWQAMHLLERFVFDTTRVIPLVILTGLSALIGVIVYFLASKILKIAEADRLANLASRLVKKIIHPKN
jgi:peptidoglycan biosynthesis protein MviN/MurJ (putative lipid II flippase)